MTRQAIAQGLLALALVFGVRMESSQDRVDLGELVSACFEEVMTCNRIS